MRKRILIVVIAIVVLTASGCTPSQYKDGVEADRYPSDDLTLYADATIYEYIEDEETVIIKYGTRGDLDEITGFYIDYFVVQEVELGKQDIESD